MNAPTRGLLAVAAILVAFSLYFLLRHDDPAPRAGTESAVATPGDLTEAEKQRASVRTQGPLQIPRAQLPTGATVAARVLDDKHRPLAGVNVELSASTSQGAITLDAARSDRTGGVAFQRCDTALGTRWFVRATGPKWVSPRTAALIGREAVLLCAQACPVHVTATAEGNQIKARLSVAIRGNSRTSVTHIGNQWIDRHEGVLLWLPLNRSIRLFAGTPTCASRVTPLRLESLLRRDVVLELTAGRVKARIEGHGSGEAVPDARCLLLGQVVSSKSSDRNGMTSIFASVLANARDLVIRRYGAHLPMGVESFDTKARPVRLRVPEVGASLRKVSVWVRNGANRPLVGASVGWYGTIGIVGIGQALTGKDGSAVGTTSLSPRFNQALIYAVGYAATHVPLTPGDHRVTLREISPVTVNIVDRAGDAVPFAEVHAAPGGAEHPRFGVWAIADVDGIARLYCDGAWRLRARRQGSDRWSITAALAAPSTTLVVPDAATEERSMEVALVAADGTHSREQLRVQVIGDSGEAQEVEATNGVARVRGNWGQTVIVQVFRPGGDVMGHYRGNIAPHITITLGEVVHVVTHIHVASGDTTQGPWEVTLRRLDAVRWIVLPDAVGTKPRIALPGPGLWLLRIVKGNLVGETEIDVPQTGQREIVADVTMRASGTAILLLPDALRGQRVVLQAHARRVADSAGSRDHTWNKRFPAMRALSSGELEIANLEPGTHKFFLFGEAADGQMWVCGRNQVQIRPGRPVTVATWSSPARFVTAPMLKAKAGVAYAPASQGAWMFGASVLRVRHDSSNQPHILVWPGDFTVYGENGAPCYRLKVADDYTLKIEDVDE